MMATTFITDQKGKKISAVLPIKAYRQLLEELEELEDIKRYDAAKKKKQVFVDADTAFKQIDAKRKSMYKLRIEKSVLKTLEKIDEPYYTKIKAVILVHKGIKNSRAETVSASGLPTIVLSTIFSTIYFL